MKARTRFVCQFPHQQSELLGVEEKRDGSLILFLKSASELRSVPECPGNQKIRNQKYSVHRSNDGVDTTLKHTIELENGDKLDTSIFVARSADDLIVPIFARACPNISLPRYAATCRPSDTVITSARLDLPCTTLVYCVVVSSAKLHVIPNATFAVVTTARFSCFDIHLVCAHVWLLATDLGTLKHSSTNSPRLNEKFLGIDFRGRDFIQPVTFERAADKVMIMMELVRLEHIESVIAKFNDPEVSRAIQLFPLSFTPFPPAEGY